MKSDGTAAMRALARWLPIGAALLVALGGATALLQTKLATTHLGRSVWSLLHLDSETSVATWFSAAVLLACGLVAWQLADNLRTHSPRDAKAYTLGAIACAGLSMEEIVGLHERLGNAMARALPLGSWSTFAWVIPGAAFVLFAATVATGFLRRQNLWLRTRLLLAGGAYFGGAVGCEALGGFIYARAGKESVLFQVEVLFEEGLEMAGAILLLGTLLRVLGTSGAPAARTDDFDQPTNPTPTSPMANQSAPRATAATKAPAPLAVDG